VAGEPFYPQMAFPAQTLMEGVLIPPGYSPLKEPYLPIGIPATSLYGAARIKGQPIYRIERRFPLPLYRQNSRPQLGRDDFIRVEREDVFPLG
jgi:hypothetical protein